MVPRGTGPGSEVTLHPSVAFLLASVKKQIAYCTKDIHTMKNAPRQLQTEISQAKQRYRQKVENEFSCMNTKQAFANLKKMSGHLDRLSVPSTTDPLKLDSDLNLFYNRFDSYDISIECESLLAVGPLPVLGDIDISTVDVTNQFKKSKANKAPGPGGIPGCLLKECAIELGPVFQPLFKQSVDSYHLENVL